MTNLTVLTYFIYLPIVLALTLYVARILFRNARVFMLDIFNGRAEIADSTNRLFEVGFYLLGALLLSGYSGLMLDLPLSSHLKILLGMTTLGFLVAADLSLARDWNLAKQREHQGSLVLTRPLAMPVSRKF